MCKVATLILPLPIFALFFLVFNVTVFRHDLLVSANNLSYCFYGNFVNEFY